MEYASTSKAYVWTVFALTVLLMISDFASRQAIVAIFPFLKNEWGLSDKELGSLSSIVALMVGLMTFPISFLVDRWGRVKSITAMACCWSLATLVSGFATNYSQMFIARAAVGLGEAGYGTAGAAILASIFPQKRRATVIGAFLASAAFGSVMGVLYGGVLAERVGWQRTLIAVGVVGLILAVLYPLVVRDYRTFPLITRSDESTAGHKMGMRDIFKELFSARAARYTYVASGLQMLVFSTLLAWMPSYLNRFAGQTPQQAAVNSAVIVLFGSLGMIWGGYVTDRLSQKKPHHKLLVPAFCGVGTTLLLSTGFLLPSGVTQFTAIALGALLAAAPAGAAAAVAADLVHPGLRTTSLATVALANNLIGLAPGPYIVGALSDIFDLRIALAVIPVVGLGAAVCFFIGSRHYEADLQRR